MKRSTLSNMSAPAGLPSRSPAHVRVHPPALITTTWLRPGRNNRSTQYTVASISSALPCLVTRSRLHVREADPGASRSVVASASPSAVQLVTSAAVPVAKVALFCAVGAWASSRGLLTPEGRRVLSSLTLHIFTPCLLFSKLAVGVGLQEVAQLWVLTANMVASHAVGLLLGMLAVRFARVPYRLRNQLVLSCGVGNVGNLPFVLLAGLAVDPALPFAAALGPAVAAELAMRYVALSNLSAALIQFPLTHIFLQKPEAVAPPSAPSKDQKGGTPASDSSAIGSGVSSVCPSSGGAVAGSESGPVSALAPAAGSTASARTAAAAGSGRWRSLAAGVLTPPTLFSLAAVGVASVGWLRDALFSPSGCLRLLGEVTDALGAVCIPALLLVLGANLSASGPWGPSSGPSSGPSPSNGLAAGGLPKAAVAAALVTRLLLLPAVCGAALLGAWRAGLLPGTDPLALLVMLVMHATPTAVLVHSMATIFRNAEDEVAALLFWQYGASLVTLPAAIGLMLQALGPAAADPGAWTWTLTGSSGAAGAAAAMKATCAAVVA